MVKQTAYDELVQKVNVINITALATTNALTAFMNKIHNVRDLVKKADLLQKYQTLRKNILLLLIIINLLMIYLIRRWKKRKIVNESHISRFINNTDLDERITKIATTAELKAEQDKITKLQTYNFSYFLGKNFFGNNGF